MVSLLVVKLLTVLVSTISISQVFLLKTNVSSFCIYIFFSKNISIYAIFSDQSFKDMLTNNMVSFEQLGPYLLAILQLLLIFELLKFEQVHWLPGDVPNMC